MGDFQEFLNHISYIQNESHFLASHGIFDQSAYPKEYIRQKLINNLYLLHIYKIQQAFAQRSIPHFFFKGIILLYDVYPAQKQRQCSDIDFFVPSMFLADAVDILGELGFEYNNIPVSHHCIDQYYSTSSTHLRPFYHYATKVMLELHTLPVYCSCEDSISEFHTLSNDSIYNDYLTILLGNRGITTFTTNKSFFLLLLHFARHIAYDVTHCIMEPESIIHMPVKTLIDCYYFYLKYSNQIDWLEIVQLAERFHAIEALQFSLKALSQLTSYDFMALTDFPSPHETVSTTFQSVYRRLNQENFIDLYLNRENPAYVRQVYWSRDFRFTQLPSTSESTANKHTFYLTNVFTSQSCKNTEHDIPYVSKPTYNKKATIFTIEAQKHILTLHIYFHLLGSLPNNNPSAISLYIDLIDYKTAAKNVFATTIGVLLVVDCTGKVLDINLLPDKYYDKFLIQTNITNQSKGDLSIDIRIPYSALSLFSKTPNRIIYNIELLQKNIGASYFQAMRTWNNTSLFDYTTMNVLEVPN